MSRFFFSKLTRRFLSKPYSTNRTPIDLQPLVPTTSTHLHNNFTIELVDDDLWPHVPRPHTPPKPLPNVDSDIDDIDDLRVRRNLFFKLDRSSREFDEYNIEFHRRNPKMKKVQEEKAEPLKKVEVKKPEKAEPLKKERTRTRTLTFNQLTGPYHFPFCLDIYVTKGSVRACIVHRATSRVVAVAHSISKDLRFDVGSRKDEKACVAVGSVLAQRAIEDDIHNVVYTPRKGDKIEGKLEVVLRAVVDGGVDVKVKLKQRKLTKMVSRYKESEALCER